jgi:hypothetical protein
MNPGLDAASCFSAPGYDAFAALRLKTGPNDETASGYSLPSQVWQSNAI